MDRDRSTKVIAIVALCVAVFGLSVGFAAFSNDLTITSEATVKPNASDFDVNFSSSDTSETDGTVTATTSNPSVTAQDARINNATAPTISGINVGFTEPGQSAKYSFFAHNAGKYNAFLNNVTFKNAKDANANIACVAAEGTNANMVASACQGISIKVKVGTETFEGSTPTIASHELTIDHYEPVEVTIEYKTGAARADKEFQIKIGDIVLTYGSVD